MPSFAQYMLLPMNKIPGQFTTASYSYGDQIG